MLIEVLCPSCYASQRIDPTSSYFDCIMCSAEFQITISETGSVSTLPISSHDQNSYKRNTVGKFDFGTIYIATNISIPSLVKIGHTTRHIDARMSELSSATGVPGKFRVIKTWEVRNSALAEQKIFSELREHRHSKEFFKLDPNQATQLISFLFRTNSELSGLLGDAKQARDQENLIAQEKVYQENLKNELIRRWNMEYFDHAQQAFQSTVSQVGEDKWNRIAILRSEFIADQDMFQNKKESQWKQVALLSLFPLAGLVAIFPPILGLAILLWPVTLFVYYHFEEKHASRGAKEISEEPWYDDFKKYAAHFEQVFRQNQYDFFKKAGIENVPSLRVPRLDEVLEQWSREI